MRFRNINDPLPLLRLTDIQFLDYLQCPNRFQLKYLTKIPSKEKVTVNALVRQVAEAYMVKLLNGKIMTMDAVKRLWDKLLDENEEIASNDKKVLEGLGLLNLLDRYFHREKVIIADLNSPYTVNFKDNIVIDGNIGTIRYNNGKLELFIIELSKQQPNQSLLNMSLKYTLQIYAADQMTEKYKIDGARIFHVRSGKEFTTYRTVKEYERLQKVVKSVAAAIREEIFFPREDYICAQCNLKNYCANL